jgi:hypothetical protein
MDGNGPSISSPNKMIFAAVTVFAVVCAPSAGLTQKGAIMIAIDKMTVGEPPTEFNFARTGQGGPAQWAVVSDPDGGRAIEQISTDRTDYRFPLAIYTPLAIKNGDVLVRFKAVAGTIDQAAGIAMRLIDFNNYYVVRANALEDNVRFYRVVKGRREQLESASLKVTAKAWHTLALKADGERFIVGYDGKVLFTASNATFKDAGRVALWTKADSITRFDRIEINEQP